MLWLYSYRFLVRFYCSLNDGSIASRSPSPAIFHPRTVITMARPGKTQSVGYACRKFRPPASMDPQVGVGAGGPSPRKLRPDSTRIAEARRRVAITIIGASTFGKMWRNIIFIFFNPIERAART